jgi:outer membrane protein OmpA-like peptidoglycan-associated protein
MKIYKSIVFLALCYTFNSFAEDVKMYDGMPSKAELLRDLMPSQPMHSEPKPAKPVQSVRDPKPSSSCSLPNFKAKTVGILIQFKRGSSWLTREGRKFADLLAQVLSADQLLDCDFEIEGHTDGSGSWAANKRLSRKRAQRVTNYLIWKHKISRARLKAIGYGEERLLEGYPSNHAKHRRVQVRNVGKFRR